MTILGNMGICIIAKEPLWVGSAVVDPLISWKAGGYQHETGANGGYLSARFELVDNITALEDWFINGLGRHIEVYSPQLDLIWAGFVNTIRYSIGGVQSTHGPLMDVVNRLAVTYRTITYNTNPPIGGIEAATPQSNNTTSQARFGILEGVLSGGSGTATEMAQVRDTYLAENAWPQVSNNLNLSRANDLSMSIEVLGYWHLLSKYYYNDNNTGTENASTKIQNIFDADPNGLFTDFNLIEANTLQFAQFDQTNDSRADGLAKGVVVRGDASDNRWLVGVTGQQRPYYKAVPTAVEYYHRLSDPAQWVTLANGSLVYPWDVKPGKWLQIADFLTSDRTALRQDSRKVFIERVSYTAPWGLSLSGGKAGTINQRLAKLGLGGTAV